MTFVFGRFTGLGNVLVGGGVQVPSEATAPWKRWAHVVDHCIWVPCPVPQHHRWPADRRKGLVLTPRAQALQAQGLPLHGTPCCLF